MEDETIVIVTARDEADRIGDTLVALAAAFAGARLIVADDGSSDATAARAREGGAEVVSQGRASGKGGAAGAAVATLNRPLSPGTVVVLADGDLGASAGALRGLADAVRAGEGDLAVAVFARRVGGGFGFAVGAAHRIIRRATGLDLRAPISGQRAMRAEVLEAVAPFAPRFGMEIGMTIDAHRAGYRVIEVALELEHRATGRSLSGFVHRGRQLADFVAVAIDRR